MLYPSKPNIPENLKKVINEQFFTNQSRHLSLLDNLDKAIHLVSKHIGRDWNRLYWQLPFHPSRGREEISKDINHIDDKYHRGDVFHVITFVHKFSSIVFVSGIIGSSSGCIDEMATFSYACKIR